MSLLYIDTDEIPGFFLLLKNHIFIAHSEDISRKFRSDNHTPFLIGLACEQDYLWVFEESFGYALEGRLTYQCEPVGFQSLPEETDLLLSYDCLINTWITLKIMLKTFLKNINKCEEHVNVGISFY